MIKRSTWIMLVVFALAFITYFIIRGRTSTGSIELTPTAPGKNFLITQADGILQSLRIYDKQYHITQMQRDTSGTWIITLPKPGIADLSLAGAAETQVGALAIVSILDNQLNLKDAGLDFPSYTIKLTFTGGIKHVIEVGTITPTNSGYYVRFDGGNVYVIRRDGIDALVNLITAPPYVATETPVPTIEVTATPTPEATTITPVTPAP
jgi:hypothetical protein